MYKINLSPYAKIFYTEWLLDSSSPRYNMLLDQTLYGDLDIDRLRRACIKYVTEHLLLNSHIQDINGEPFWRRNNEIVELEYIDSPITKNDALKFISQSFDLHAGPLYRFKLSRTSNNSHRLIVVLHHILVDGASLDRGLFKSLSCYYNHEGYSTEYTIDQQIKLVTDLEETLSIQLRENKDKHKEFWRNQLSSAEKVDLTFLKSASNHFEDSFLTEECSPIGTIRFGFGEEVVARLNQIKRNYVITPYIYGQCIFAMLLNRFTHQENITINFPISIKEGANFIYGAQLNSNIINYHFDRVTTVIDLFNQSRDFFRSLKQNNINHGYYPITNVVQENNNKHLLDICFVQTNLRDVTFRFSGIDNVDVSYDSNVDSISGGMILFEQETRGNKLNYQVRFDKRIYSEDLLRSFIKHHDKLFLDVLEDLSINNINKPVSLYKLLNAQQYQNLVYELNQTEYEYPQNITIHKLFEKQVLENPENISVVYDSVKLTYQELNHKANQLANYLQLCYNIRPDDLIVLCLDKSEYMPLAMLATLKSGGAYVPIDPKYPDERISYIIDDTKAEVILTTSNYRGRFQQIIKSKARSIDVIAIDSQETQAKLAKQTKNNPVASTASNNLIYVIYTSGTTGRPKGVLLEHRGIVNLITYLIDYIQLNNKSVGSNYAAFGFDASVTEIYPILLSGGTLHIIKDSDRNDPDKINEYFNKNNVTFAFLPTKFAEFFCKLKNTSLVNLIVAGDKLDKFTKQSYRVINAYGPTEASVHTTSFVVDKSYRNIPIGKAINNVKCYIVDNELNLQPIGVIGELMIGGECLARGYLNQPNLTAEKFVSNPYQTSEEKLQNRNSRLYKTGDLVRMLSDGNMEYIGRNDFQVKIRGFRIELDEIESKLTSYPGIKQAVVLAKDRTAGNINDKYLVAYYVADGQLDESGLQRYLTMQLPEYMVPSVLMYLKQLPLAINGKLDRKALPEPKSESDKYEESRNEREQMICDGFAKVLGLKKAGINDDFFKLGGDSIRAITLTSVLQNNFDIKVSDVFKMRTPKEIAHNIGFEKDLLKRKLEKIKLGYKNKQKSMTQPAGYLQKKIDAYLAAADDFKINPDMRKNIRNVLLTGATGYLGCNILNQLLLLTSYCVFLLIRASSQNDAYDRINKKYQFYFGKSLDYALGKRIFVIRADIEKDNLGLLESEYKDLAAKTDSIIHSAALVKHYGEYDKSYSANVLATVNLLKFALGTKLKDFHFISSYSVLTFGTVPGYKEYTYTEEDMPDNLEPLYNVYNQTKLQGENEVIKFRNYGISGNIYRVGNLAFMAENCRAQENIEDNAFFNWLKCILNVRCICEDLSTFEISQVDLTAEGVVKLFDKTDANNLVHHLFNYNLLNIVDAIPIKKLIMEEFIDNIIVNLGDNSYHDLIVRFLSRQGWLDGNGLKNTTSIEVLQSRTQIILKQLDFEWPPITNEVFCNYLELLGLLGENK